MTSLELNLRLWARGEADRMRKEKGLPPYKWEELPMSLPVRTACSDCQKKGHFCTAQIVLDTDDGRLPLCLDCADEKPCSYDRNPPVKPSDIGDIFTPIIGIAPRSSKVTVSNPALANPPEKKKESFKNAAQKKHVKTDRHEEWERAIIEDAGMTSVTGLSIKLGCVSWIVYHYRKMHNIPCSGSSAGPRKPRNTEIKQKIADDNGKTPTRTLARNIGVDRKYVKQERKKMQEIQKVDPAEIHVESVEKKASVSYAGVIADLEAKRKNLDNLIAGLKDIVQMGELR